MARTIAFSDALACTRLLGECSELGHDALAWQKRLTEGAEQLIGGVSPAFKVVELVPGPPLMRDTMLSGNDSAMHRSFDDCLREGGHKDLPALETLIGGVVSDGELAFRYSQLDGGLHAFHESYFYDRYFRDLRIGDA